MRMILPFPRLQRAMSDPPDADRPAPIAGHYANVFQIGHNAFEFVIDFGQQYGADDHARFHTRIVTAPAHVQTLIDTLADSLAHYRGEFGDPSAPREEAR